MPLFSQHARYVLYICWGWGEDVARMENRHTPSLSGRKQARHASLPLFSVQLILSHHHNFSGHKGCQPCHSSQNHAWGVHRTTEEAEESVLTRQGE